MTINALSGIAIPQYRLRGKELVGVRSARVRAASPSGPSVHEIGLGSAASRAQAAPKAGAQGIVPCLRNRRSQLERPCGCGVRMRFSPTASQSVLHFVNTMSTRRGAKAALPGTGPLTLGVAWWKHHELRRAGCWVTAAYDFPNFWMLSPGKVPDRVLGRSARAETPLFPAIVRSAPRSTSPQVLPQQPRKRLLGANRLFEARPEVPMRRMTCGLYGSGIRASRSSASCCACGATYRSQDVHVAMDVEFQPLTAFENDRCVLERLPTFEPVEGEAGGLNVSPPARPYQFALGTRSWASINCQPNASAQWASDATPGATPGRAVPCCLADCGPLIFSNLIPIGDRT